MQAEQIILFVAVAALALALVVVVVVPRLRGGARGGVPSDSSRAGRGQPKTPPDDAVRAQVGPVAAMPPPPPPVATMVCPTCRRQYAPGLRFCPYDARVLTLDVKSTGAKAGDSLLVTAATNTGKICPNCARRYDAVAMVCARDGSALVSVN